MSREQQRVAKARKLIVQAEATLMVEWKTRQRRVTDTYSYLVDRKGARYDNHRLAKMIDKVHDALREIDFPT